MGDKNKQDTYVNVALEGAAEEVVQRYGSAVKEHFVAYSGVDNETGEQLKKGLKDIAKSKINPDYAKTNIKQQAGFAAENKYTARQNAERIIIMAIHECLTNTVKHAEGNELYVNIFNSHTAIMAEIMNNGKPPTHTVIESGGLLNLRHTVERAGGMMEIKSSPRFVLQVTLTSRCIAC